MLKMKSVRVKADLKSRWQEPEDPSGPVRFRGRSKPRTSIRFTSICPVSEAETTAAGSVALDANGFNRELKTN